MIAVGAHYGGEELRGSPIFEAITTLAIAIKNARGSDVSESKIRLNPIFVVPGNVSGRLPFDGLRYGKFSKEEPCLAVEVAVPSQMVRSEACGDYLIKELRGCNAMAFEFYRQKKMEFPLRDAESLVTEVAHQLGWRP
jgi:hypothetical protein